MGVNNAEHFFRKHISSERDESALEVHVVVVGRRTFFSCESLDSCGGNLRVELGRPDDLRGLAMMFLQAYFKARELRELRVHEEIEVIRRAMGRAAITEQDPDNMGLKPRKKPANEQVTVYCGVARGEITSWEHCECFACLTKQIRELDRLREQARRREGIKP